MKCDQGEGEPGDLCPGGGSAYGPAAEAIPWNVRNVKYYRLELLKERD